MKVRVPHLVVKAGRSGRPLHYWQPSALLRKAGWKAVRLPDDLAAAIAEAEAWNRKVADWRGGAPASSPAAARRQVERFARRETVRQLIRDFRADRWPELKPATRKQYDYALGVIEAWAGDQPLPFVTADRCRVLLKELARPAPGSRVARLHRAAGIGRVLRTLMGWAAQRERIAANPMDRVTIREPKPRQQVWPDSAIEAMVAMADALRAPSLGDAVLLAADTGQREGDLLLQRHIPRRGDGRRWLKLQQGKTGVWVEMPLTARLEARLDAAEARARAASVASVRILVREGSGRPWDQEAFIKAIAQLREAAIAGRPDLGLTPCPELAGLQFRDLRRTIVVRMAEAGVDLPGIAAISGHRIDACKKILETYLPRTGKMAAAAIERLEAHRAAGATGAAAAGPERQEA